MTNSDSLVEVGIDFGGTATRVVVRRGDSTVGEATVTTSEFGEGLPAERVRNLWAVVERVVPKDVTISSVGVAASGPIDLRSGVINNEDTLKWFSGFSIVDHLKRLVNVPVAIENDAMAAAIGEYHYGAGRGAERLLLLTLGTGIGVALLEKGFPFRQVDGQHPEAGHIPIFDNAIACYCGLTGCWEQSASRLALERELASHYVDVVTPIEVMKLALAHARSGDRTIQEIFTEYGRKLGRGIAVLHTVYGPSVTVIGGSVANNLDLFRLGIDESLAQASGFYLPVAIVRAELGAEAGAIGAAALAKMTLS
jgi:glucokinase